MYRLFFLICWLPLTYAVANQVGNSSIPVECCSTCPHFRLSSSYSPGNSPGVEPSYESVGIVYFGGLSPGATVPLIEVWQNFLNNGTYATSGGIGSRYMNEAGDKVFGINFFSDSRKCSPCHLYQLGGGVEFFTPHFDFRINSFFPLNNSCCSDPIVYDDYIGDYLVLATFEEFAFKGFEVECGFRFNIPGNICFYSAIGPYYLTSAIAKSWGVQLRARCDIWNTFFCEVQITNDSIFNDCYRGYFGVVIPLDRLSSGLKRCLCWYDQPVHRQGIIRIGNACRYQTNY
jgi:hypothetical protein